jgi:hypothetical protein
MRKLLLALAIAFALLLAFVLCRDAKPWHPNVQLTFEGFVPRGFVTNINAQFRVSGYPPEESITFILEDLSRKAGTNWEGYSMELGPFDVDLAQVTLPNGQSQLLAFVPVETTNVPSRVIIEVKRQPKGLALRWQNLREKWAEWRGRSARTEWKGPSFFVTNETVAIESLPSQP